MSIQRFSGQVRSSGLAVVVALTLALLATGCSCGASPQAAPTAVAHDVTTPVVAPTAIPQPTATPVIEGPTLLLLEPSVVLDFAVGETREVQIMIQNVDGMREIELHISFEPRYVNVEDADPGTAGLQIRPGVMPTPAQVIQNEVNNDAGLLIYHVAQEPGSAARGSGVVASLTLRAMTEGGSPLQFTTVKLYDSAGQLMPISEQNVFNGLVSIGVSDVTVEPADEASPEATAVPTVPAAAPTAPASGFTHYTVQRGDTLYSIAKRYGTTVEAIMAANGIADPRTLRAGQVLLIPIAGGTTGARTYVVQAGDTLYSIAKRFGTTVETLAALNGLTPPYTIKVGQKLIIP